MDIMAVNSRLPDFLRGDMWAAIAAVRLGERRLGRPGARSTAFGDVQGGARRTSWTTASRCRGRRSRALPKGRFELAEEQDDGEIHRVAIEITGDAFARRPPRQSRTRPLGLTTPAGTASSSARRWRSRR